MTDQPTIFLTRRLPEVAIEYLNQHCRLVGNLDDRPIQRDELLAGVDDADGLLCLLSDAINSELLEKASRLKVVSNYAVGFNNIDLDACRKRGIKVSNTPDVLTDTTADMAMTLALSAARRLVEGDRLVRTGQWTGWAPLQLLGNGISGQTMGLVGLGRIGKAMIQRCRGFGMTVTYWNRTRLDPAKETELGIEFKELDDLCRTADFFSLHVALSEATHHLIDARRLGLMKPNAIVVNTARGAVIDEAALAEALKDRSIAAAGLDVFEKEPELHPELANLDNAILAPHLGSATLETRNAMGMMAARDCVSGAYGGGIIHQVA
ncbi:MAG: D-glycerate dehydrogenase [Planctomycetota bacterium]